MDMIMGGQILDYETKVIFRQGLQKGIEYGKIIARFDDGMSIDAIAEKSKISIVAQPSGCVFVHHGQRTPTKVADIGVRC